MNIYELNTAKLSFKMSSERGELFPSDEDQFFQRIFGEDDLSQRGMHTSRYVKLILIAETLGLHKRCVTGATTRASVLASTIFCGRRKSKATFAPLN